MENKNDSLPVAPETEAPNDQTNPPDKGTVLATSASANALTSQEKDEKVLSPEEQAALEDEMDKRRALMDYLKTDVLNRLEEEHAETRLGALMRSKNFWYCVFGLIFILWMGGLILWVAHDLAK